MFIPKSILYTVGIIKTAANGYQLAFYNSASGQCTGPFLGLWSGGRDAGCRTDYAGVAQEVVITNDRDGDHNTTVVFFSSNDCNDANVISVSQSSGCMAIGSTITQGYGSFTVLDATTREKQDSTENHESLPDPSRVKGSRHNGDATPTHHGDAHEHDSAIYRWHQPEFWWMNGMIISLPLVSICWRSPNRPLCTALSMIFRSEFLNSPLVGPLVGSGISGLAVMTINNKWPPGKEEPSQRSTAEGVADFLKESIKEVAYSPDVEAVELVLTLQDGRTQTISVAATERERGVSATGNGN